MELGSGGLAQTYHFDVVLEFPTLGTFPLRAGFMDSLNTAGFGLLGHSGFMDRLIVSFSGQKRVVHRSITGPRLSAAERDLLEPLQVFVLHCLLVHLRQESIKTVPQPVAWKSMCPGGEIGRRKGLKILFPATGVWVQFPPRAPIIPRHECIAGYE